MAMSIYWSIDEKGLKDESESVQLRVWRVARASKLQPQA
jgi:hypothetical protein